MKSFIVVLLVFVATATANPISNVRILATSSVPRNPIEDILVLNGVENCGYSVVHDVRLPHCSSSPCIFNRGESYTIEAEFTTRGERCNPFFRSILAHRNEIEVIQDDLYLAPEVRLEANTRYIFTYDFTIPPNGFKGDHAEFRFKVYQNMVAELCVAIPSTIV